MKVIFYDKGSVGSKPTDPLLSPGKWVKILR